MQWFPEVNHFNPKTPIILVGTKLDLRDSLQTVQSLKDNDMKPVSSEQVILQKNSIIIAIIFIFIFLLFKKKKQKGEKLAKEIGAAKFLECSAKNQKGLPIVFEEAVKAVFADQKEKTGPNKKKKDKCVIM